MHEFPTIAFGQTTEREPESKQHPAAEVILSALESPESVAREFCTRCGMLAEINAAVLARKGFSPESLRAGDYLETNGCPDCPDQIDDTQRNVRLKNTREFAS